MSDDFELTIDPELRIATGGRPREVCAVKVGAFQLCAAYVRRMAVSGDREASRLADFLDHVGITPDFDPSPIDRPPERLNA
jgi:hypothetical protein